MRRTLTVVLVLASSRLAAQDYTAPRSANLSTSGIRKVSVTAHAGTLRIDGRSGAREVSVRGTAHASSRSLLDDIKLFTETRNGVIYVEADIPDRERWSDRDEQTSLDLTITVPSDMELDVEDGSGGVEIRNVGPLDLSDGSGEATVEHVGGRLRVRDGSGSLHITDVRGDVEVKDGSGELEIRDVQGSVDVPQKGSGPLRIANVSKSVRVGHKGSGSIEADHVGGDLTVDQSSSGNVEYADVKGRVDVPTRDRRRWR